MRMHMLLTPHTITARINTVSMITAMTVITTVTRVVTTLRTVTAKMRASADLPWTMKASRRFRRQGIIRIIAWPSSCRPFCLQWRIAYRTAIHAR